MTNDDVDLVSRAQYIAKQTVKNVEIKGYGTIQSKFLKAEYRSGMSTSTQYYCT